MKVAVVGVTGLVGTVMLEVLEELDFPIDELVPVASSRSVGRKIKFKGKEIEIVSMEDGIASACDLALFSAGGVVSKEFAPLWKAAGTTVIDNSSAWRMDPDKLLMVPEVNGHLLNANAKIIANPNCSTIQLVVALAPLHKKYGIKRLVISTYQSFTGTGVNAVKQYESERDGKEISKDEMAYPHAIFENCIPHCDVFMDNNYTKEEMKLVHETRKIMGDDSLKITATAVRVPVNGGHSEAVNVEFIEDFDLSELRAVLAEANGITILDDIDNNIYPMPLYAKGKNDVFVGRLRRDESIENGLNMFIVSDNLRKGAATNAVHIAQYLHMKGMLLRKATV